MIEYAIAAAAVGGAIAIIDQQNLIPQISNNPRQLWIWDPARYQPAPAARLNTPIQVQPYLSPRQQLQRAEFVAIGAQQLVNAVKRDHPELAGSKYQMTVQPQAEFIQPYRPPPSIGGY
jgi:hypothetical protein